MPDCPHCRRYREELDEMRKALVQERERRREDRADDGAALRLVSEFGITRQEALLLRALAGSPGIVTKDALHEAISAWSPDILRKTVDVIVCKLRQKCPALKIETVWAVGYRLDAASRDWVLGVLEPSS